MVVPVAFSTRFILPKKKKKRAKQPHFMPGSDHTMWLFQTSQTYWRIFFLSFGQEPGNTTSLTLTNHHSCPCSSGRKGETFLIMVIEETSRNMLKELSNSARKNKEFRHYGCVGSYCARYLSTISPHDKNLSSCDTDDIVDDVFAYVPWQWRLTISHVNREQAWQKAGFRLLRRMN